MILWFTDQNVISPITNKPLNMIGKYLIKPNSLIIRFVTIPNVILFFIKTRLNQLFLLKSNFSIEKLGNNKRRLCFWINFNNIIIYNMRYEIISLIFKTNQIIGWLINSSSPKTKRRSKYESYPYKKIAANVLRPQEIPCT